MFDSHLRPLIDPPLKRAGQAIAAQGVAANTITWLGFGLGLLAGAAIAGEWYWLGLLLLIANRLADGLDGAVARASRAGSSDLGGYLDIVLDFLIYSGIVFAFAVADPGRGLAAAFLIWSFVGTGSSFLAYAIIAGQRGINSEAQGKKSFYYLHGLAEGSETIAVLVLLCLLPDYFGVIALLFGIVCWLTTAGRIVQGIKVFGPSP